MNTRWSTRYRVLCRVSTIFNRARIIELYRFAPGWQHLKIEPLDISITHPYILLSHTTGIGPAEFFFARVLIAVGIACRSPLLYFQFVSLSRSLLPQTAELRLYHEASARTLVVLDLDGWKYQFVVESTRGSTKQRREPTI